MTSQSAMRIVDLSDDAVSCLPRTYGPDSGPSVRLVVSDWSARRLAPNKSQTNTLFAIWTELAQNTSLATRFSTTSCQVLAVTDRPMEEKIETTAAVSASLVLRTQTGTKGECECLSVHRSPDITIPTKANSWIYGQVLEYRQSKLQMIQMRVLVVMIRRNVNFEHLLR
jgi:hypothetical protein